MGSQSLGTTRSSQSRSFYQVSAPKQASEDSPTGYSTPESPPSTPAQSQDTPQVSGDGQNGVGGQPPTDDMRGQYVPPGAMDEEVRAIQEYEGWKPPQTRAAEWLGENVQTDKLITGVLSGIITGILVGAILAYFEFK